MIINKRDDVETAFKAAGCFCVYKDRVLVMQRQRHKPYGLHWAIPTGKIEAGESAKECIVRELEEELGLRVDTSLLFEIGDDIVNNDDDGTTFEYVSFVLELDERPTLTLKVDEVRKTEWVSLRRIIKRRVVPYFYNTVHYLIDWRLSRPTQQRLFPMREANSAKHRPA